MSNIDRFALDFLLLSTVFVIKPFSFHVPVPMLGRKQVTLGLMTAPIIAICILWASQCISAAQIRDGIIGTGRAPAPQTPNFSTDALIDNVKPYNILILFISLAYMALTLDVIGILQSVALWVHDKGGSNGRKLLLTGVSMVIGNDAVICECSTCLREDLCH